jgi:hypothetical protein
MSRRKQAKRARFYASLRWKSCLTLEKMLISREILRRNQLNGAAMDRRWADLMAYGTGAVRIDENGVMTHIPYPELMAELEAVADRLGAP